MNRARPTVLASVALLWGATAQHAQAQRAPLELRGYLSTSVERTGDEAQGGSLAFSIGRLGEGVADVVCRWRTTGEDTDRVCELTAADGSVGHLWWLERAGAAGMRWRGRDHAVVRPSPSDERWALCGTATTSSAVKAGGGDAVALVIAGPDALALAPGLGPDAVEAVALFTITARVAGWPWPWSSDQAGTCRAPGAREADGAAAASAWFAARAAEAVKIGDEPPPPDTPIWRGLFGFHFGASGVLRSTLLTGLGDVIGGVPSQSRIALGVELFERVSLEAELGLSPSDVDDDARVQLAAGPSGVFAPWRFEGGLALRATALHLGSVALYAGGALGLTTGSLEVTTDNFRPATCSDGGCDPARGAQVIVDHGGWVVAPILGARLRLEALSGFELVLELRLPIAPWGAPTFTSSGEASAAASSEAQLTRAWRDDAESIRLQVTLGLVLWR